MSEENEYFCPSCGGAIKVKGYYADTFGDEVTCQNCGAVSVITHECAWGEDSECTTYLESK